MRILASAFLENLQKRTTIVAEPEVQKYYDEHRDQYEQAQVRRLSVPVAVPTENGRPLDRSAVKSEMEQLRSRAVAGEDFNQLQQDAYRHLHIQATPPPVNVLMLRRSNVQGDEVKAFALNPGEISTVLDLPAAFAVVKLESKESMPIEAVRQEIEAALRRDRLQNEVRELSKRISAQFNLQYLEMSSQPDMFGLASIIPATSRGSMRRASGTRRYGPGTTRRE
jgi:peptidyl-prolyl cis-trans isomerase D